MNMIMHDHALLFIFLLKAYLINLINIMVGRVQECKRIERSKGLKKKTNRIENIMNGFLFFKSRRITSLMREKVRLINMQFAQIFIKVISTFKVG